jgi:hypothetical protein
MGQPPSPAKHFLPSTHLYTASACRMLWSMRCTSRVRLSSCVLSCIRCCQKVLRATSASRCDLRASLHERVSNAGGQLVMICTALRVMS